MMFNTNNINMSALSNGDHRTPQLIHQHHSSSSSSTSSAGSNNDSNNNSLYIAGYNQATGSNPSALLAHSNVGSGNTNGGNASSTNISPGAHIQLQHVVQPNNHLHHHHHHHAYGLGNGSHHRHQQSGGLQGLTNLNGQQQQQQQQHQQQQQQFVNGGGHHTIDSTTLSSSTPSQNKKSVDKGSDEYKKRRERNNIAVRKSREKAKMRSRETEKRVAELSKENQLYRAQYEELRREFNVLKSLLLKTGLTEQVIEDEAQRYTTTTIQHQQLNQVSNSHTVHNHVVTNSNQPQYTNASIDQWTDGMSAYVEDWAS